MFKFFKWAKDKRLVKLRAQKEQLKNEFVSYVNAYKDQNSTMETCTCSSMVLN